jgi:hypothetical protein
MRLALLISFVALMLVCHLADSASIRSRTDEIKLDARELGNKLDSASRQRRDIKLHRKLEESLDSKHFQGLLSHIRSRTSHHEPSASDRSVKGTGEPAEVSDMASDRHVKGTGKLSGRDRILAGHLSHKHSRTSHHESSASDRSVKGTGEPAEVSDIASDRRVKGTGKLSGKDHSSSSRHSHREPAAADRRVKAIETP